MVSRLSRHRRVSALSTNDIDYLYLSGYKFSLSPYVGIFSGKPQSGN